MTEGENVRVIVPKLLFMPSPGGQVGDTGTISGPNGTVDVVNTTKVADSIVLHEGRVAKGSISKGDTVDLGVTSIRQK